MSVGRNINLPVIQVLRKRVGYASFATSGNSVIAGVLPAGATVLRTLVAIETAFDGSAPALKAGDATTTDRFISGGAVTEATTGVYQQLNIGVNKITADTTAVIALTHTTAPTAGAALVIIEFVTPTSDKDSETIFDNT